MPKKPEESPDRDAHADQTGQQHGGDVLDSRTAGSSRRGAGAAEHGQCNGDHQGAEKQRSFCPSIALPSVEPKVAPRTPANVKTMAHGHFTCPARACPARFAAALTATATALVPMARWGEETLPDRPEGDCQHGAAAPDEPRTSPTRVPEKSVRPSVRRGGGHGRAPAGTEKSRPDRAGATRTGAERSQAVDRHLEEPLSRLVGGGSSPARMFTWMEG